MRLLDSVCKVLSDNYAGVPVHIQEMPKDFERDCFLVTLATDGSSIKNRNIYEENPIFQIVYFGKLNEVHQVIAENLYKMRGELKALFLLRLAIPVVPLEGVKEKDRYAKIQTYSDEVRLSEGALYTKLTLSFTESVPNVDNSDPVGEVDLETIKTK